MTMVRKRLSSSLTVLALHKHHLKCKCSATQLFFAETVSCSIWHHSTPPFACIALSLSYLLIPISCTVSPSNCNLQVGVSRWQQKQAMVRDMYAHNKSTPDMNHEQKVMYVLQLPYYSICGLRHCMCLYVCAMIECEWCTSLSSFRCPGHFQSREVSLSHFESYDSIILSLSVSPLAPLSYTHTFSLPLSLPTSRAACSLLLRH